MISTPQTLFKLMILYFLDCAGFSLSNAVISDYILEKGYTDYFNIQKAFSELEDEELISSVSTHKSTHYRITSEGKETLGFFHYEISPAIKAEIKDYLKEHFNTIVEMLSVSSDYKRIRTNEYLVSLKITERDTLIMALDITVATEEAALRCMSNWDKNNSDIYAYLIRSLM